MSRLMEIELEKLLNARFEKMIQISQRQFSSVHPHQCLKLVSGGTPFGYEALQTGVIRTIQTGTFALVFQYFDNDKGSFVEVMNNQSGFSHSITGTDACIILKSGAPNDNVKNHEWPEDIGLGIPDLGLKITDLKNLSKICLIKINDILQKKIGDVVTFENYDCTVLSFADMKDCLSPADFKKFISFPFLSLYIRYSSLGCEDWIMLYSTALGSSILIKSIARPMKVAYFDSYEKTFD
ncbi:unnamed protein product [Mucor fragilis]